MWIVPLQTARTAAATAGEGDEEAAWRERLLAAAGRIETYGGHDGCKVSEQYTTTSVIRLECDSYWRIYAFFHR